MNLFDLGNDKAAGEVYNESADPVAGDSEEPLKKSLVKVPLCQVKWSWKGKKLMKIS